MAASPVAIANSALLLLNEDQITSFGDPRLSARILSTQYDIQRQALLRAYRWSFATKRAILAPEVDTPIFGFGYKFLLPTDCLRLIGLYDTNSSDGQRNYTGSDETYKVEGRYILCDLNPLYITYTGDVTNTTDMDALFSEALAFQLAKTLAMPLTNDTGKYKLADARFIETVRTAKAMSAIENTPEVLMASNWVDSRFSGYDRHPLMGL